MRRLFLISSYCLAFTPNYAAVLVAFLCALQVRHKLPNSYVQFHADQTLSPTQRQQLQLQGTDHCLSGREEEGQLWSGPNIPPKNVSTKV